MKLAVSEVDMEVSTQLLVLDRAESEPTVKVLDCGKSIISQIYTYASDADYGDPTQYDLKIKREGAGRRN